MPFQAKKVEFRPDLAGGKRPRMMTWTPHNDHKKSSDNLNVVFNGFLNNFPKNKFIKTSISTCWIQNLRQGTNSRYLDHVVRVKREQIVSLITLE